MFHKVYRPPKRIKSFNYRGFRIDIYDDSYYQPFRYEWKVTAKSNSAKRICDIDYKLHRRPYILTEKYEFYDPTSVTDIKYCIMYAKVKVNEILSPLYMRFLMLK